MRKLGNQVVFIGFFTFAGYDRLIIEDTEDKCWNSMKKEYYKWRKEYGQNPYFYTFKEAIEWFGYRVLHVNVGEIIEY